MAKLNTGFRSFKLTELAVDNAVSIFLITFMILLFGTRAYIEMPKEQYPEIRQPEIFINTVYFGNSAADIESLITRPIEREVNTIVGVKEIISTNLQDYSVINVKFSSDLDNDLALQKVKDAVDRAKPDMPSDLDTEPEITDVDFSQFPIMSINIFGDLGPEQLKKYAEYLEEEIEDLKEVSEVDIKGDLEREIQIDVDLPKMQSMLVSFEDIGNAVSAENLTLSGGEIVANDFRRAISIKGEFSNVSEIENIIVKSENLKPIYMRDIANITYGYKERTSIARSDLLPVLSLDVIKRKGENMLAASDKIKQIIKHAENNVFPTELEVYIFNDLSLATKDSVDNLGNSIISGVILVVMVLLFFLGLRNAAFVGMAIPLSMLTGILILNVLGITLNVVVLFSLILALGLLVDNAIVIVENIYRYMQEGHDSRTASKRGASEVAMPIIASTATTLAAFAPLYFWLGIMGDFMQYLPLTLIIVLSSSLFVALVINPVLTSRFMKLDEKSDDEGVFSRKSKNILIGCMLMLAFAVLAHFSGLLWLRNLLALALIVTLLNHFVLRGASRYFQAVVLPILERAYNRFIAAVLKGFMPYLLFIGTFFLLIGSLALLAFRSPEMVFFPSADPLYVNVFVELPIGKDIEATNKILLEIEEKVFEKMKPYDAVVDAVLCQIGENTSDPNQPPEPGASPHKARLTVAFVEAKYRGEINTFDIMEEIREVVQGYPGVLISVDKNADGPPAGKPISIELRGEEIEELLPLAQEVKEYINAKNIPGIEELFQDVKLGKPELLVNIDREAARRYEVSTYNIADAIRTAVFGKEVSKFKEGEDEYPIFVRLDSKYRNNPENLLNQKITFRSPSSGQIMQVPIAAVADLSYGSTYSAIKRKDQERTVTLFSNVVKGYNANKINERLAQVMEGFNMPAGFSYAFTGEQQQQNEDMDFLNTAFLMALFGIFIIIVAQFNSIISPFIIIMSVLFSTIGVFLGYSLTNMDIVMIMTGVGIISLAGVVVNNAIVLIDYINLLIKQRREKEGYESMHQMSPTLIKEAIVLGGATRLRPVLLTAITTVLGLIPLAVGFNFNFFTLITDLDPQLFIGGDNVAFWGPMAWTVIYGLIFATFLTLIVVPVMYWLAYRFNSGLASLRGRLFA